MYECAIRKDLIVAAAQFFFSFFFILGAIHFLERVSLGGSRVLTRVLSSRGEGNSGRVRSISGRVCGVNYIIGSQLNYRSYHSVP